MRQSMTFNDPVYGLITGAEGSISDLASIRILRETCQWCAVPVLTGGTLVDSYPCIRMALVIIAVMPVVAIAMDSGSSAVFPRQSLVSQGGRRTLCQERPAGCNQTFLRDAALGYSLTLSTNDDFD